MAEPFCQTEAPDEVSLAFVAAVNNRQADVVDKLLRDNETLRQNIDQHWFSFDAPAVIAAKNSEAILKVLLKHGADINSRSSWWAGSFGVLDGASAQMANFLIDRGAKWDIHSAAEQGKLDLVAEFLERDPSLVNELGGDGQTPLHVASTLEMVDFLLDHGADQNIRCQDHSATAAQYAVSNPEKCRHLVMRGSTPDIFMACAIGDRELVENVLQAEPDSITSRIGSCPHTSPVDERSHLHIYFWKLLSATSPLDVAREFNHLQLYDELYRRSPLKQKFLAACWDGDQEKASAALAKQPDLLTQLDDREKTEMARAAWDGRLASVRVMLELGFDPHLPGDDNSTPLDRAAFHGHREIVELLLEIDADPPLKFKNAHGGTPLGACVFGSVHGWKQGTDYIGTAQALIDAGSEVHPDWLACENQPMNDLLRKHMPNS